jgi:hypothetical protein
MSTCFVVFALLYPVRDFVTTFPQVVVARTLHERKHLLCHFGQGDGGKLRGMRARMVVQERMCTTTMARSSPERFRVRDLMQELQLHGVSPCIAGESAISFDLLFLVRDRLRCCNLATWSEAFLKKLDVETELSVLRSGKMALPCHGYYSLLRVMCKSGSISVGNTKRGSCCAL